MEGKVECTCYEECCPVLPYSSSFWKCRKGSVEKGEIIRCLCVLWTVCCRWLCTRVHTRTESQALSIYSKDTQLPPQFHNAQLASADIIWLIGILQSPCWRTPRAAMRRGVDCMHLCECVFSECLFVCPFCTNTLANVMQLSKAPTAKNPFRW